MTQKEAKASGVMANPSFTLYHNDMSGNPPTGAELTQPIFDTGTLEKGTLRGPMLIEPLAFAYTDERDIHDTLKCVITRYEEDTTYDTELYFDGDEDSLIITGVAKHGEYDLKQKKYIYFYDDRNYRIRFYQNGLEDTWESIYLESVTFRYVDSNNIQHYTNKSTPYNEIIPQMDAFTVSISTDSSGNGVETVSRDYKTTPGEQGGIFDEITAVTATFKDGSGDTSSAIETTTADATDESGGKLARIRVKGAATSTTVYADVIIYGFRYAVVV